MYLTNIIYNIIILIVYRYNIYNKQKQYLNLVKEIRIFYFITDSYKINRRD